MIRDFFTRLFSSIPKSPDPESVRKREELARCRFFIDEVLDFGDGTVGLRGLVARGRVYEDEPLELVGYGIRSTVRCSSIWKGRARQDYAWEQVHFDPFVLRVKRGESGIFRKGQVLAAPGTAHDALRIAATLEITGTPGNLGRPLAQGGAYTLSFREGAVGAAVTLPEGSPQALPGETAGVEITLSEPLPLEADDEIRLGALGHVFARGRVVEVLAEA